MRQCLNGRRFTVQYLSTKSCLCPFKIHILCTFHSNSVTSPNCVYLPSIFLKGNQCRRLADCVYLPLQNEKALNIYGDYLSPWKLSAVCFFFLFFLEVGQCLLISDGESCTEQTLRSQYDSSPTMPPSASLSASNSVFHRLLRSRIVRVFSYVQMIWEVPSPPSGGGIYTWMELGLLSYLVCFPGGCDNIFKLMLSNQEHDAVKSAWCIPMWSPLSAPLFLCLCLLLSGIKGEPGSYIYLVWCVTDSYLQKAVESVSAATRLQCNHLGQLRLSKLGLLKVGFLPLTVWGY